MSVSIAAWMLSASPERAPSSPLPANWMTLVMLAAASATTMPTTMSSSTSVNPDSFVSVPASFLITCLNMI
jgi:hypothetical protein